MNGLFSENKECSSCAACENVCSKDAISMQLDKHGFLRPVIDEVKCIKCGLCKKKCPWIKKVQGPNCNFEHPITYAAYAKDSSIRKESSSGGIFSILAIEILKQHGAIIGVAQLSPTNFQHLIIRNEEDLRKLRGSKYVQAAPGKIYRETKKLLQKNINVLFSGTPCQIAALYSYLGERHYENLWTIDIVCHGTPSIKLLEKYNQEIEYRTNGKILYSKFRDKISGWKQFSMTQVIECHNGSIHYESNSLQNDLFLKLFLSNICLNSSCYNCKYNGIPRIADITLGDFWGIKKFHPEMDDDKGTSVVLINNSKGDTLFNRIKSQIIFCRSELNKAINNNPCILQSYSMNKKIFDFLKDIDYFSLKELFSKYII